MGNGSNDSSADEESFSYAMQIAQSLVLPMSMHAAIQLQVFDIIAQAGPDAKLSAKEIAAKLPTKNPEAPSMLDRLLRLLATHCIVGCSLANDEEGGHPRRLYSLTPVSKYFVPNEDGVSLGPFMNLAQDNVFLASCSPIRRQSHHRNPSHQTNQRIAGEFESSTFSVYFTNFPEIWIGTYKLRFYKARCQEKITAHPPSNDFNPKPTVCNEDSPTKVEANRDVFKESIPSNHLQQPEKTFDENNDSNESPNHSSNSITINLENGFLVIKINVEDWLRSKKSESKIDHVSVVNSANTEAVEPSKALARLPNPIIPPSSDIVTCHEPMRFQLPFCLRMAPIYNWTLVNFLSSCGKPFESHKLNSNHLTVENIGCSPCSDDELSNDPNVVLDQDQNYYLVDSDGYGTPGSPCF
ncbi:hypothetical protein CCACVL1_12238 [Corchorus capsularis]|uniref:O-methyltransferase dimerisation domain-containing protein n=1 Tax=Corchorus capsularis TaxID=210143 RepID=A0A1R3IGQ0_COCAP|nr:hypothetical protein CCACVL1_12238 [Corchorus capsularis]